MIRPLVLVLLGALAGGAIVSVIHSPAPRPSATARDITAVPKMSLADADDHRRENFAKLDSITGILALPTRFMQTEAIYAIAGRSNSAGIQDLIFAANRIADENLRIAALDILFFRLAEIDVDSALALARTAYFANERHIERQVWMAFAYLDLDAAIEFARSQTDPSRRSVAAQSLFAAYGDLNNPTVERIESELGIKPDGARRTQYLYRLADSSPDAAVAYINSVASSSDRRELVSSLASYLAEADPGLAASIAELFSNPGDRQRYASVVASYAARQDPKSVIDRLIASDRSDTDSWQLYSAFTELAAEDVDSAIQYFDMLRSPDDRSSFGSLIVRQLAERDVEEALAWAREHDASGYPYLMASLVRQISVTEPARAFEIAQQTDNAHYRSALVQHALSGLIHKDPTTALGYLQQIDDPRLRDETLGKLVSGLMRSDPEGAVEIILSLDGEAAERYFASAGRYISNTGTAIRLLPRVPESQQHAWRYQIARQLAQSGNVDEAAEFISQFDGQEGFASLQAAVITGMGERDPENAWQLAGQIPDQETRDSAYLQIIRNYANREPAQAAGQLARIGDEYQRAEATGTVVAQWAARDVGAATYFTRNLPVGQQKDMAIVGLASRWTDFGPTERGLVDSMQSQEVREQALSALVYSVMRRDPARVRQLIDTVPLTDAQRRQIESVLSQQSWVY